ncbi:hypothetical protein G7Y41_09035 [Schaalia sp. ZJ405]|uniref:hypothetical protein n=1 Tax=Schaalia sp. ZJ405 TaxID=2709403 RepID=UPI0013EA57C3|nr:hypothetical protein [Schaalia sp. ZJ405]QPK81165.1 hypothetical protein G7Y41_09035 [Schaalia sp. ZJ405]
MSPEQAHQAQATPQPGSAEYPGPAHIPCAASQSLAIVPADNCSLMLRELKAARAKPS